MDCEHFYIEEYKSLKNELLSLVTESRKLETYAIGAVAAFYAWAAKSQPAHHVWFVPSGLVILGAIRSFALFTRIHDLAHYIRCEREVNCPGWETYFHRRAKSRLSPTAIAFWGLLLSTTILVPRFLW